MHRYFLIYVKLKAYLYIKDQPNKVRGSAEKSK